MIIKRSELRFIDDQLSLIANRCPVCDGVVLWDIEEFIGNCINCGEEIEVDEEG